MWRYHIGWLSGLFSLVVMALILIGHEYSYKVYEWRQLTRVIFFSILFASLVIFLRFWGRPFVWDMELSDAVLAVTGFILLWYTLETYALRWETVKQTKQMARQTEQVRRQIDIQIRPVVVLRYDGAKPALRNIGQGAAVAINVEPIRVGLPEHHAEVRVERVDILPPGEIRVLTTRSFVDGRERNEDFLSAHLDPDPRIAPRAYDVTIRYSDIEAQEYESRARFGPDEFRFLGSRRIEGN